MNKPSLKLRSINKIKYFLLFLLLSLNLNAKKIDQTIPADQIASEEGIIEKVKTFLFSENEQFLLKNNGSIDEIGLSIVLEKDKEEDNNALWTEIVRIFVGFGIFCEKLNAEKQERPEVLAQLEQLIVNLKEILSSESDSIHAKLGLSLHAEQACEQSDSSNEQEIENKEIEEVKD